MLSSGTDPASHITKYTVVYQEKRKADRVALHGKGLERSTGLHVHGERYA